METKVKEEVKVEAGVKVREDLNDMVAKIKFKAPEVDRYGNTRNAVCEVKLFTGAVISFADKEGLYDLLKSFQDLGETNFYKARLVEEIKNSKVDLTDDDENDVSKTYFCVRYDLSNGKTFRLFATRKYVARDMIENYYRLFKKQQKK